MSTPLASLDVFYGELTVNRAYVYARLPRPVEDAELSLVGQVRGPRCLHAQTLPLTSPLVDLGAGPTLLARALVPDPCFWSPDLPAIYDVTVNLLRGTEIIASARREIGLKSLGVRGRNFALEGKRWVLRGVSAESTMNTLPREWHAASAALCSPTLRVGQASPANHASSAGLAHTECGPTGDDQLAEASQWGALTLADVSESGEEALARLRELASFPAVAIAGIRGELPSDFKPSQVCPNVLLAQSIAATGEIRPQPWAQLLLVPAGDANLIAGVASSVEVPIVAVRRLPAPVPIAAARAACDQLQRDLAPLGQFAGYIV